MTLLYGYRARTPRINTAASVESRLHAQLLLVRLRTIA
jgi:hypothetical protein